MSDETPYSNRELDARHKSIDDKLDLILDQTTKHNHRLTKVELQKAKLESSIATIKWTLVSIVLPVAYLLLEKFI